MSEPGGGGVCTWGWWGVSGWRTCLAQLPAPAPPTPPAPPSGPDPQPCGHVAFLSLCASLLAPSPGQSLFYPFLLGLAPHPALLGLQLGMLA